MKPQSISRILPFLLLALVAAPIAPLLPGGHAQAQQALTATPTATPASPGYETDRAALIALYNATDGPNWDDNTYWNTNRPLDDWFGIDTDPDGVGRVTSLKRKNNGLRGRLPAALGNLAKLQYLNLWGNQLTGGIPSQLGNLSNLKTLELYQNNLSGRIPTALGNLSNLRRMDLRGNQLTGSIPTQLGNLSNLSSLYLSGNQFTGCIPAALRNVRSNDLASLNLPFCVTPTPTATPTAETTVTPTPTATPTSTTGATEQGNDPQQPTATPTPTPTPTVTPTSTTGASSQVDDPQELTATPTPTAIPTTETTVTPTPTVTPTSTTGATGQVDDSQGLTATPTPTPTATPTPQAPELTAPALTAQAATDAVELRWEAVAGAVRYDLFSWWDREVGWQQLDDGSLTGTSHTHTAVTPGTTYYYTIRSVNAAGDTSTWSDYESVTIPSSTPSISTPTLTVRSAQGRIELRWEEVASAARYELWTWWDREVGWQQLDDGNLTGTNYTHTAVTPGTTYYYTIRSVSAEGEASEWSEYVSATAIASE